MHTKAAGGRDFLDDWIRSSDKETLELDGMSTRGRKILDELNRVYELTGVLIRVARALAPRIRRIYQAVGRPVTILDIGMRDGTFLHLLAELGSTERVPLELHGVEFRPDIADLARGRCAERGFHVHCDPERRLSAFRPGRFDLVCSTFMLHHQEPSEIRGMIEASVRLSRFSVFHFDLSRSLWSVVATWSAFTLLGMRESRGDAVLSCRRAYKKKELQKLVEALGEAERTSVRGGFPFYLIVECSAE